MSLSQLFQSFFGYSSNHPTFSRNINNSGDDDDDNGNDIYHSMNDNPLKEFDEVFKLFDNILGRFSFSEYPVFSSDNHPELDDEQGSGGSLRDHMLKKPDTENKRTHDFHFDFGEMPFWFGNHPDSRGVRYTESKKDEDLDGCINNGQDLDEILSQKDNRLVPRLQPPNFNSSFKSVSVRTIRRPDGGIEEWRTVQNSDGKKETTVTRRIGDQSHTTQTITDKDGNEQKEERTNNIEEKDMKTFEDYFMKEDLSQPQMPRNQFPNQNESLFRKFFGRRVGLEDD